MLSKMNDKLSKLDEVLRLSKANEKKIKTLEESIQWIRP